MGVRFPSVASNTLLNANVGINTETIVVTTPPLTLPLDFAQILIFWYILHIVGATAVTTQVAIRRGTTVAGTLVNANLPVTAAAGNRLILSGFSIDTPGAVGGQQYTLTCLDPASTAVGAIGEAVLIAVAL